MKYKIITLFTVAIILLLCSFAIDYEPVKGRFHQHLQPIPPNTCDVNSDVLCTHLPIIEINTNGEIPPAFIGDTEEPNYEVVQAEIKVYDNPGQFNTIGETPTVESNATFRTRGASSRSFDKKGYKIKLKNEDYTKSIDESLLGMEAASDWVLNAPYLDKSLIRNYISYNLAGSIMDYAPEVRFSEIVVNGEYQGLYLLLEENEYSDEGRIELTESDPDITQTSYIIRADRGARSEEDELITFGNISGLTNKVDDKAGQFEILYPNKTLTPDQKKYIQHDISKFEKAIYSFDYDDDEKGYEKYIDVDSFAEYFIINEFSLNYDAVDLSTYYYKDVRGKLKVAVWDFNSAFNYYEKDLIENQSFDLNTRYWFEALFKDDDFVDLVISKYKRLRETYLSDEYLFNYIDETVEYLGEAIERNYEVWGYSLQEDYDNAVLKPQERNPLSHEESIKQLKETIRIRGEYLDENFDELYRISHYSVNKKYDHKGD